MNETDKLFKGVVGFLQWLLPKKKELGLHNLKSITKIESAKTPDEIIAGVNMFKQEVGDELFTNLVQEWGATQKQTLKDGGSFNYIKSMNGNRYNVLMDMLHNPRNKEVLVGDSEQVVIAEHVPGEESMYIKTSNPKKDIVVDFFGSEPSSYTIREINGPDTTFYVGGIVPTEIMPPMDFNAKNSDYSTRKHFNNSIERIREKINNYKHKGL